MKLLTVEQIRDMRERLKRGDLGEFDKAELIDHAEASLLIPSQPKETAGEFLAKKKMEQLRELNQQLREENQRLKSDQANRGLIPGFIWEALTRNGRCGMAQIYLNSTGEYHLSVEIGPGFGPRIGRTVRMHPHEFQNPQFRNQVWEELVAELENRSR